MLRTTVVNLRLRLHIQAAQLAHQGLQQRGATTSRPAQNDKHLSGLQYAVELIEDGLLWAVPKELPEAEGCHEQRAHVLLKIDGGAGSAYLEVLPDDTCTSLDNIVLVHQFHQPAVNR